jgi:hypothetical protein
MIFKKVRNKTVSIIRNHAARKRDFNKSTFCEELPFDCPLYQCLKQWSKDKINEFEIAQYAEHINYFIQHRFDLLGSGWVQVRHGMKCRGLEGHKYEMGVSFNIDEEGRWLKGIINQSNLSEAQRIWKLIDSNYKHIDWQIDFKSGYRWAENTWFRDIKFGGLSGVDVKVPWELARMQHLPQMAIYSLSLTENSQEQSIVRNEFRNQILDFIATNPPGFGINWTCPMEAAIRAANWLMAYDLFCSGGAEFDEAFNAIFVRSIYEHGLHIVNNLEWTKQRRGNHYLADITGLAFIAAHLPSVRQTEAWLAFAVQELVSEVAHQFYPDGGNFEGSTAYHRFSTEMVYFATSLILGLSQERKEKLKSYDHKALSTGWGKPKLKPAPLPFYSTPENSDQRREKSPFPHWYFERMERMAEFIIDITKPDGHIPQIGDNDSGRFFRLDSKYDHMNVKHARETYANLETYDELPDDACYYSEDQLDCSHLVAAAYGLLGREDFVLWLDGQKKTRSMPDYLVVRSLSGEKEVGTLRLTQRNKEDNDFFTLGDENIHKKFSENCSSSEENLRITEFPVQIKDLQGLVLQAYPDFGLYIIKNQDSFYLSIRCWSGSEPTHTGHMHNDQLSIELWIAGKAVVSDPGSYLYTPSEKERNHYRSVNAHFTPWPLDLEPAEFGPGLFSLPAPIKAQVLYFGKEGFAGQLIHPYGVMRKITLTSSGIRIIDSAGVPFNKKKHDPPIHYSSGYGNLLTMQAR